MSTDTREGRPRAPHRRSCTPPTAVRRRPRPARPSAPRSTAPGLRLPQVVQTVMDGYADRPALGQRAVEFVTDPATGRTTAELLPRFDTITYRRAVGPRAAQSPPRCASTPCSPATASPSSASPASTTPIVDMALTPPGRGAPFRCRPARRSPSCSPIVAETEPVADRVEHRLPRRRRRTDAHRPPPRSGWSCSTTTPRSTTTARRSRPPIARLAGTGTSPSKPSADVLARGARPPHGPERRLAADDDDPGAADLHLRQHRHPEGRDVHRAQGRQLLAGRSQLATGTTTGASCRRSR